MAFAAGSSSKGGVTSTMTMPAHRTSLLIFLAVEKEVFHMKILDTAHYLSCTLSWTLFRLIIPRHVKGLPDTNCMVSFLQTHLLYEQTKEPADFADEIGYDAEADDETARCDAGQEFICAKVGKQIEEEANNKQDQAGSEMGLEQESNESSHNDVDDLSSSESYGDAEHLVLGFHRKYNCRWCEKTGRYNDSCTGCTLLRPVPQMLCADSHTTVPLILGSRTVCDNCEDDDLRAGDPVRYCRKCGWFCCLSCVAGYFEDSVDIAVSSQLDGHYRFGNLPLQCVLSCSPFSEFASTCWQPWAFVCSHCRSRFLFLPDFTQ